MKNIAILAPGEEDKGNEREHCREYLPPMDGKPEGGCLDFVPQGMSERARAARALHLCLYCYDAKFPEPQARKLPACRQGSKRLLTPWDKERMQKPRFNAPDETNWTPERYDRWMGYWGDRDN